MGLLLNSRLSATPKNVTHATLANLGSAQSVVAGTVVIVTDYGGTIAVSDGVRWRLERLYSTWDSKPAASLVPAGTDLRVTDLNNAIFVSDGTNWQPVGSVKTTTLANLGSAQSAGVGAERIITDQSNAPVFVSDKSWIDAVPKRKNALRIIPFGDSLSSSQQGPITSGAARTIYDSGYMNWINAYCDGRFRVLTATGLGGSLSLTGDAFGGVHGQNTSAMLARIYPDAISHKPDIISILAGTNDVIALTADVTIANLTSMYNSVLANGIDLWVVTIPPKQVTSTAAEALNVLKINEFIRNFARKNNGVTLLDMFPVGIDYSSLYGAAKTNYLRADLIHPTAKYLRAFAYAVAPTLKQRYQNCVTHINSVVDNRAVNAASNHLLSNGLFTGTGGSINNGSGSVPTGWQSYNASGTGTAVSSIADSVDGIGKTWTVVMTATAANQQLALRTNDTTKSVMSTSEKYEFEVYVKATGMSNVSRLMLAVIYTVDGVTYQANAFDTPSNVAAEHSQADFEQELCFKCPVFAPAGSVITGFNANIQAYFTAAGGATISLSKADLRVVTEF